MQRDGAGGHKFPDIDPKWAQCMICKDSGLVGGDTIEFRYCLCPAGVKMKASDADSMTSSLVSANETRAKLGIK